MKFCEKCGNQLTDDAVICVNCGCAVKSNLDEETNAAPQELFSSKNSITAIVMAGIGILIPIMGFVFLGPIIDLILSIACIVFSIIALVTAIKAKKERSTDSLASIALPVAIVGIVMSTIFTLISAALTLLVGAYFGVILAYIMEVLSMSGMA